MSERSERFDTVLRLCENDYRRTVLSVLADERRQLTVDDLAKTIVRNDLQTPLQEASEETLIGLRTELLHVHVPKLQAVGFVEFDPERELVEPTDAFDRADQFLTPILDADPAVEAPAAMQS